MNHKECEQPGCYPQDGGCVLGELHPRSCSYNMMYEKAIDPSTEDGTESTLDHEMDISHKLFPWGGNQLGHHDLTFITAQAPITLIGIIGPANSGKTTVLAALYMLVRNGYNPRGLRFAGSITLHGWEKISSFLTLDVNNEWMFPPHTSRSHESRNPGLLHLAFKETGIKSETKHLIFTDAPGEWFSEWCINATSDNSQGAEWVDNYADALLVFADCEALSGKSRGQARSEIIQLIHRVRNNKTSRPVGLAWTKSDQEIDDKIVSKIKAAADKKFEKLKEFKVSVLRNGDQDLLANILEIIPWSLSRSKERTELTYPFHPFFIGR